MEWEEFENKIKEIYDFIKESEHSRLEEYGGFEEMERHPNWHLLFIALSKFIEDETNIDK